ncbi:MAG: membrane dipeptidase [Prevotella sp.]|nr:membrane dipeptidase [Candidatus Prevotella equi]
MRNYSIEDLTAEAYRQFPEAERKPVIGLTANHSDIDVTLRDAYHKQIVAAGGVPVIIPPVTDVSVVVNTLQHLDGIILTGGGDYNPLWCGEEPSPKLHNINAVRDSAELLITRLAYNRQIPMLGICRGIQTLAMALEGHVAQDIAERKDAITSDKPVKHSQDADRTEATHTVTIAKDSTLYNIHRAECIAVNSFHHQVVDEPGKHFSAVAYSSDGLIEAIESSENKNIMGVQWHPEWLGEEGLPLFKWIVDSAREYRTTADLHSRILTLDTHCDTPMFFHQGVDFTQRDSRILVDLHKMTEGRQDATIMVCYLPQPKDGKTFREMVHFDIDSPTLYTDFIFDEIGKIVASQPNYLAFARTPEELYANKAMGKKSIVLSIENGLAIGDDIKNIQHFVDRGIVYITLCHNGDNAICDSAKGNNTHGGVSAFGETVIKEMNRLGVMVDLSHGGEKSFYDALEISSKPIVCSHSNCRALCDHPRNLTDDQLRALAKKGGVAHTTFYPGFLKATGEADILDAIKHLEHAISIMGIDHVGIGTDFDGDGGVPGMANSSEIMNFTRQLLRRRYSEVDIEKIWGGNWLRVMKEVQK